MRKTFFASMLCFIASVCISVNAWAGAIITPMLTAPAAVLIDAKSGVVIYEKDMNTKYFPASITKIMTALISIENSNENYDQRIPFSHNAVFTIPLGSSHIAMDEGETLTLTQALQGLMLESANEVANALGEYFSGSSGDFGVMMTERAKELGAINTNFTNAHGLHDDNHYTTAFDMALIMKEAVKQPKFIEMITTQSAKIPPTEKQPKERPLNNSHKMIHPGHQYYNEYVVGGKTGFTNEAGNTLVTYAKNGNMELIAVILHDESAAKAYEDTRILFDYGFSMYGNVKVFDASGFEEHISIVESREGGVVDTGVIPVYAKDDLTLFLPSTIKSSDIKKEVDMPYQLEPPVAKDEKVGTLKLLYKDTLLGSVELFAGEEAALNLTAMPQTAAERSKEAGGISPLKIVLATLAAIVTMSVMYILVERSRRKRKRELARARRRRAMRMRQVQEAGSYGNYRYRN